MTDALIITAPVGEQYPSVNHTGGDGFRGGKKTPAYHELFEAVKKAAEREIARTGWKTAAYYCATSIVVYRNTRIHLDLGNVGKCENDALTAGGVWVDDRWARPYFPDIEYDPSAPSRVLIIVRRRFPDMQFTAAALAPAPPRKRRARIVAAPKSPKSEKPDLADLPAGTSSAKSQQPYGGRMAEINGRPVPVADALAEVRERFR